MFSDCGLYILSIPISILLLNNSEDCVVATKKMHDFFMLLLCQAIPELCNYDVHWRRVISCRFPDGVRNYN